MAKLNTVFSALQTNLEIVNRNFQRLGQIITSLSQNVFSLVHIAEVAVSSGQTTYNISHSLNRTPIGWFIIDRTDAFVADPVRMTDNSQTERVLKLSIYVSSDQTIKVLIF